MTTASRPFIQPARTPLDARFVADDDPAGDDPTVLGCIDLRPPADAAAGGAVPRPAAPALAADLGAACREVWLSGRGDVQCGQGGGWRHANDGEFLFATTHLPLDGVCTAATRAAYLQGFELARRWGGTVFRMWNYIPHINADNAEGLEVYRDFCRGRAQALETLGIGPAAMPAATGVGTAATAGAGHIAVALLATRSARVTAIENPAQVAAYRYPGRYGPRPPGFARATHLNLPTGERALFVSGTASIVGHETVHAGDVARQCTQTLDHLAVLLSAETLERHGLAGDAITPRDLDAVKVYVRRAADLPVVRRLCEAAFDPCAQIAWLRADLCRADLLVEIEGWVPFARRSTLR